MSREYGNPPEPESCREVGLPNTITTKANQVFLTPVVGTAMVPGALGRPLPPQAIARQLRLTFKGQPVKVSVGDETYYVSKEGWCVV